MTDIPGTSKTSFEIEKEKEKISSQPVSLSLVNVHEIKRIKKEGSQIEDNNWQNQLKYWLMLGSIPSIIFVLLGLFSDWRFYLMIPAGPIVSIFTWYLWKILKKYEEKIDVLK